MKKQIETSVVYLTPSEVELQFPNALMAKVNSHIVMLARAQDLRVKVEYFDAVWGRTVVNMCVAAH